MRKKHFLYGFATITVISLLIVTLFPVMTGHTMSMSIKTEKFVSLKEDIQHDLMPSGKYRCCLEEPCSSCIELTPWHGEGASCNCLEDLVNGKAPCDECLGGILAGRGNPYLKEHFVDALTEELGNREVIKQIIEEKY